MLGKQVYHCCLEFRSTEWSLTCSLVLVQITSGICYSSVHKMNTSLKAQSNLGARCSWNVILQLGTSVHCHSLLFSLSFFFEYFTNISHMLGKQVHDCCLKTIATMWLDFWLFLGLYWADSILLFEIWKFIVWFLIWVWDANIFWGLISSISLPPVPPTHTHTLYLSISLGSLRRRGKAYLLQAVCLVQGIHICNRAFSWKMSIAFADQGADACAWSCLY